MRRSGQKVVSGLLIGLGIFRMVATDYFFTHFSKTGFYLGLCLVASGVIRFSFRSLFRN